MPISYPSINRPQQRLVKTTTEPQNQATYIKRIATNSINFKAIALHPAAFMLPAITFFLQFIKNRLEKSSIKSFEDLTAGLISSEAVNAEEAVDSNHEEINYFTSEYFYAIITSHDEYEYKHRSYSIRYSQYKETYAPILKQLNTRQNNLITKINQYIQYLEKVAKFGIKNLAKIKNQKILKKINNELTPLIEILVQNLKKFDSFKEPTNYQNAGVDINVEIKKKNMQELANYYKKSNEFVKTMINAAGSILSLDNKFPGLIEPSYKLQIDRIINNIYYKTIAIFNQEISNSDKLSTERLIYHLAKLKSSYSLLKAISDSVIFKELDEEKNILNAIIKYNTENIQQVLKEILEEESNTTFLFTYNYISRYNWLKAEIETRYDQLKTLESENPINIENIRKDLRTLAERQEIMDCTKIFIYGVLGELTQKTSFFNLRIREQNFVWHKYHISKEEEIRTNIDSPFNDWKKRAEEWMRKKHDENKKYTMLFSDESNTEPLAGDINNTDQASNSTIKNKVYNLFSKDDQKSDPIEDEIKDSKEIGNTTQDKTDEY